MTKRKEKTEATPPVAVDASLHPDDVKRHTQSVAAALCGIHRCTLLRMEQRRELSPPTWVRLPTPHRVYSDRDIKHIKQVLKDRAEKVGRNFMDEKLEAANREALGQDGQT